MEKKPRKKEPGKQAPNEQEPNQKEPRKKKDGSDWSTNRATHPIPEWETQAKLLLKAEVARKGQNIKKLAKLLETVGIFETGPQVNRKINRGKFSAGFLLACLTVLGVEEIRMSDVRVSIPKPADAKGTVAKAVGQ